MAVTHQHHWDYQLHHPDFKHSITGRLYLEQKPSESMQHLMMKACSYFIFYHPKLEIERYVQQRHKPDLVRFHHHGTIVEWIDCGHTYLKKLKRISNLNHSTFITIVKKNLVELTAYRKKAISYVNRPERLRFQTYQNQFIDQLSQYAYQAQSMEVTLLKEHEQMSHLYVSVGQYDLHSKIIWLAD